MSSITPSRQVQSGAPHAPARVDTNQLPGKLGARAIRQKGGLEAVQARALFESLQQALSALPQDTDTADLHFSQLSLSSTSRLNDSECLISLMSTDNDEKRENEKLIRKRFDKALRVSYHEECFRLTIDCKKIQSQVALPKWSSLMRNLKNEKVKLDIVLDRVCQEEIAILRDALPTTFVVDSLKCISDKQDDAFQCSKQLANFDLSQLTALDLSECSVDSGFYNSLQSYEDLIELLKACQRLDVIKGLSSKNIPSSLSEFLEEPVSRRKVVTYDCTQPLPHALLKLLFERNPSVEMLKIVGCQSHSQLTDLFNLIKTLNTTVQGFIFQSFNRQLYDRIPGCVKLHFTHDPSVMYWY